MGDNPSKAQEKPSAPTPPPQSSGPEDFGDLDPPFQLEPGRPNISYYWVDRRVYNAENQISYNFFRKQFRMEIFTSIEGLRFVLDQGPPPHPVKVLTAAGLPDEDFRYLHNEPKVAEVFLFCANEERAKLLMRNFTKIAGYGLRKEQVAEKMREAEGRDPKKVVPITEDLIGRRVQGISNGTNASDKQLNPTAAGTSAQVATTSSAVNVNNSVVGVSLDPVNVNSSGVMVNLNQSAVNVNMNPQVNVNQSSVIVNMNPPVNVNQSSVVVNMSPPAANINVNQSSVVVNLDPPKPVNINNSNVNIVM